MLQAVLLVPLILQIPSLILAQTTTATCTYALWTSNALGESPCLVWAKVQNFCTPHASVGPITPATAPYPSPNGATATQCNCNTVAYNLMAACTWCQPNLYSSDWVSETNWKAGCTSYTASPPNGVFSAVTVPSWALADNSGDPDNSWESFKASSIAALGLSPSATATAAGSGTRTAIPTRTSTGFGGGYTYTPSGGGRGGGFNDYVDPVDVGRAVGIALGIILAISVLIWGIGLAVFLIRQKKRKAWYGPVAAHYEAGGRPPWEGGASQPLMAPWSPTTPAPPTASVSPAPYSQDTQYTHSQDTQYAQYTTPPPQPYSTPSPAPYYQDIGQTGQAPVAQNQYDPYNQAQNQIPQTGYANPHQTGTAYV